MGGKSTSKGIFCQVLAAVIEALDDSTSWDEITLEPDTEKDKVDIELRSGGLLCKAIQVKSSINSFQKNDVIKWIDEICEDVLKAESNSPICVVYLIGPITGGVSDLSKELEKWNSQKNNLLPAENPEALKNIDLDRYKDIYITVENPASAVKTIIKIACDTMHKYLSGKKIVRKHRQVKMMTNIISSRLSEYSTNGRTMDREQFKKLLASWISELKDKKIKQEKIVSVRTFKRATDKIHGKADIAICLLEMFENRKLKTSYSWNESVYGRLIDETYPLIENSQNVKYDLHLNVVLSVAFALGRILDSKSGVDALPFQRTSDAGTMQWGQKEELDGDVYEDWITDIKVIDTSDQESAIDVLTISVTKDITREVEDYLIEEKKKVNKKITCKVAECGNDAIRSGRHAKFLADEIYKIIAEERSNKALHIFISGPATFCYYLGRLSRGFGPIVLYEHDFERVSDDIYILSFAFPNAFD